MITHYRHIDTVGGLRSAQTAGHAIYRASDLPHPERLVHAGSISRTRASGQARYGRRWAAAAFLLLAALLALGVLFGARPAAGAVSAAPPKPPTCAIGWRLRPTCRMYGTFLVCMKMCVKQTR